MLDEPHHNIEQYIDNVLERVIAYPHDEHRLTLARESAGDVFSNYDPETRLQRIEQAVIILVTINSYGIFFYQISKQVIYVGIFLNEFCNFLKK